MVAENEWLRYLAKYHFPFHHKRFSIFLYPDSIPISNKETQNTYSGNVAYLNPRPNSKQIELAI